MVQHNTTTKEQFAMTSNIFIYDKTMVTLGETPDGLSQRAATTAELAADMSLQESNATDNLPSA